MGEIVVWGSGAIGGTIGARLVRKGEEILFVDTFLPHVKAMDEKGLTILEDDGKLTVNVKACLPDAITSSLDLVFLAVKSHHTAQALEMIEPWIGEDSLVVCLQNGLNEEWVAETIGADRTMGALVNFSADYIAPGEILYGGAGSLILGELNGRTTERLHRVARLLDQAMPATVTENLWGFKWAKLCYGALLVATALVDEPVSEIVLRSEAIQSTLVALVGELLEVAEAYRVKTEPFDEFDPELFRKAGKGDWKSLAKAMERIANHYRTQTKGKTGIWRDLAVKRRKTEVDALLGAAVKKGEEAGRPCPLNRRLIELIHEIEDGGRSMAWGNLDELIRVYRRERND